MKTVYLVIERSEDDNSWQLPEAAFTSRKAAKEYREHLGRGYFIFTMELDDETL